jgi:hypothetical protein
MLLTLTWREIFEFVHQRFTNYGPGKRDNKQWDKVGRRLYQLVTEYSREEVLEMAQSLLQ